MKHKKVFAAAVLAAAGLGLLGTGVVSAHGLFGGSNATPEEIAIHQSTMFQQQADLLGISVDEVKNAWAEGTSIKDLAQKHGITDEQLKAKMQSLRLAEVKDRLQTLVDKGVITQAQADKRYATMQTNMDQAKERMRGFRHMW